MTRNELVRLQIICQQYAKQQGMKDPESWKELLWVLTNGVAASFVAENVKGGSEDQREQPANAALAAIKAALRADETVASYNLPQLAAEYVQGTRQWMYDEADKWLSSQTAPSQAGAIWGPAAAANGAAAASRMFILAAEPGMGKSVFSAVVDTKLVARRNAAMGSNRPRLLLAHHFFKVGRG